MSNAASQRQEAIANRTRDVLDCFRASEWARDNVRITGDNWRLTDQEPDSLGMVELVMAAEKAFAVEIRDETFARCKTVGDLAEVIAAQLVDNPSRNLKLVQYDASLPMRAPGGRS